jgi:hypothetical protein
MYAVNKTLQYLVFLVSEGDHAAFRHLYAMLAPATLATVRRDLADDDQSMNVVRATFSEVWQMCAFNARRGSPQPDVGAWVAAIAERRCEERRAALDWAALDSSSRSDTALWTVSLAAHDRRIERVLALMLEGSDSINSRKYLENVNL